MVFRFRAKGDLRITEVGVVGSVDPEVFARVIAATDYGQDVEARLTQATADAAAAVDAAPSQPQADALSASDAPSASNPMMTRSAAYDQQPFIDVRRFDARGTGHDDDTDALQAALNACPEQGVVVLPAPSMHYRISGTLNIPSNVSLKGAHGLVLIRGTDPKAELLRHSPTLPSQSFRLENLSLIGGSNGIRVSGAGAYRDSGIHHVEIAGQSNACVLIDGSTWIGTRSSDMNLTAAPNGMLLRSVGGGGLNAAAFSNVRVSNTFECGVQLDSSPGISSTCHFSNLMFEGNQKLSLWLLNSSADLYTSYYENNGSAGNGADITYPDILLDTNFNGTFGGPSRCTLWNGNFAGAYPGNPQGHVRVRFANHESQFTAHNCFWTNAGTDLIDGGGFTVGSMIELHGLGQPAVINFTGGSFLSTQPGRIQLSLDGCSVLTGSLPPEGRVAANPSSLYMQTLPKPSTAGIVWIKSLGNGNTGWDRFEKACRTTLDLTNANGGNNANPAIALPTPSHFQPANAAAPSGWIPISIGGVVRLMPWYAI